MIMSFPIFFFTLLPLLFQSSHCTTTILVDGSSEWKNPIVHIGDSIIFKHKQHYNIYIFKNQQAFDLCNFTQATLLTNPNTTYYTWHPSRPGFFYFSFNDGSLKECQVSQKLAFKVTSAVAAATTPQASAIPPFSGEVSSSPSPFRGQFHPLKVVSPAPAPSTAPLVPYKSGSMPFINSNPVIPLPTDEVDSATIRPLPTSGHQEQVMIGSFGFLIAVLSFTLWLQ